MKRLLEIAATLGAAGLFAVAMLGFAFFGGILFGLVGKGIGTVDMLKWLEDWQGLVGAMLGALVTGAAAFMITVQIRADDEREEKRERAVRLKLAKQLAREAQSFLGTLATWTALSELLLPLQLSEQTEMGSHVIPPIRYNPTAEVIIDTARRRVLSPGRFDRYFDRIEDLDHQSAEYFSYFHDELQIAKLNQEFEASRAGQFAREFVLLHISGEGLIDSLEATIRAGGKDPGVSRPRNIGWFNEMNKKWATRIEVFRKHYSHYKVR